MNFSNPIVISKKIPYNHSLLKAKSFTASLAVHTSVFLAAAYFTASHPIVPDRADERVMISLSDFTETAGDIHQLESAAPEVSKPEVRPQPLSESTAVPAPAPIQPSPLPKTPEGTPSSTPSVSPEASAPLAQIPMPASSLPSDSIDSPQSLPSPPVHELPKAPTKGNDTGGAALGHIRAMIEKAVIYPTIARKLRLEGIVTVMFILNSDGTVDTARIASSSGSKILDEKAVRTILGLSGDYPKLGKTVELSIPIAFELKR